MKFAKIDMYDNLLKLTTAKIQVLLENWVMHLSGHGLKALTIQAKLSAVELFLEMNKVVYHKRILHKLIPSRDYISGGDIPFTSEEIQRMLTSTTKLRSKALIHYLASTGARPASLTDPVPRIKHLENMPNGCKAIKIYDGSKEGYWAFLTPEATKALDNYLGSRRMNGEDLGLESPIFINSNMNAKRRKNDYLSSKPARQLISNILTSAGIERKLIGKRYDKATMYGFRKRFNTILKLNNNVNSNIAEKLMAHKRGLDGTYLKPTREECFIEFLKAIPELTISDEFRDKFKITKLEAEKSEIEKLKLEVTKIRGDYQQEAEARTAITHFYMNGSTEGLDKVDPNVLEFWGYWGALKASGNFPREFVTPKEQLIKIAKNTPKLAKLIGKNGENLIPQGSCWVVKE
ncbi:MAG TPA: site-specific integrase [Candidatus Nitrosotalea sp.]|nr:site-specific integrase [Candidatus Nitrosotalea sp.]